MSTRARRIATGALAGMVGSALFVLVFTVEGWLRPDYSARAQYVSELALGPRGWVQNLNFLVSGALILLFAWGVAAVFPSGRASRAAPILFALIGMGLFLSGFFVMDPFSTPRTAWTDHGITHQLLGALVFALLPAVCLVMARRFWVDSAWRAYRWWTVAVILVLLAAILTLRIGPTMPPAPPTLFNPWRGLIQRAILVPFMVWLFTVAFKMRTLAQGA